MRQPRRILLADDDPHDIELMLTALASHGLAQYVDVVRDGVEALDYLHRRGAYAGREPDDPAAVLLDIKMPRLDGLEVLRHIREYPSLKMLPVVILTSSQEEEDLLRGYQLGTNAYVVKPVSLSDFLKTAEQLGLFWALVNEPPPRTVSHEEHDQSPSTG